MKAIIALKPEDSKRLIARGVVSLPEVHQALEKGIIHIARGTTCAYVFEELTGRKIDINKYVAGYIGNGGLRVLPANERLKPFTLKKGEVLEIEPNEVLSEMGYGDVFIKGGNALDFEGRVGVLCANREGGTIGGAIGTITARGIHLIMPISLRKLVPNIPKGANLGGIDECDYTMGEKVALFPVINGKVITEIDAFKHLFDVEATLIAQGGLGDMEGALIFGLVGEKNQVNRVIENLCLPKIYHGQT